jgi:hypothetical protein
LTLNLTLALIFEPRIGRCPRSATPIRSRLGSNNGNPEAVPLYVLSKPISTAGTQDDSSRCASGDLYSHIADSRDDVHDPAQRLDIGTHRIHLGDLAVLDL